MEDNKLVKEFELILRPPSIIAKLPLVVTLNAAIEKYFLVEYNATHDLALNLGQSLLDFDNLGYRAGGIQLMGEGQAGQGQSIRCYISVFDGVKTQFAEFQVAGDKVQLCTDRNGLDLVSKDFAWPNVTRLMSIVKNNLIDPIQMQSISFHEIFGHFNGRMYELNLDRGWLPGQKFKHVQYKLAG